MRTIDEIYQSMKNEYETRCDLVLRDGGDMSLRFYAIAAQVLSLEAHGEFILRQSFPQTAQGEYLDYHAAVRSLGRLGETNSEGVIRFYVNAAAVQSINIPEGVVCTDSDGREYITTTAKTLEVGSLYCDVPAKSKVGGAANNVPQSAIAYMPLPPTGITRCSNPAPFYGGTDGESDEALRQRVLESYSLLPNGANSAYYEAQALTIDGVFAVEVLPKARGLGTVNVAVASVSGAPSNDVLEKVQEHLSLIREICVDVLAVKANLVTHNVSVQIKTDNFEETRPLVESAIRAYFTGALLGKPVLLAELGKAIFSVSNVSNYKITAPSADVPAVGGVLPILGTLTITELG